MVKLKNVKQHKLWPVIELKTNKTLTKEPRKKNTNQKNSDKIKKNNIWKIVI
jgi:hypothetical protein